MVWDPSVLFPAAAAAGMLKSVTATLANGSQITFQANFETPEIPFQLQDVKVQSSEYMIEYQSAAAPTLAQGNAVLIDAVKYTVREPPAKTGNGFFSKVLLTKV